MQLSYKCNFLSQISIAAWVSEIWTLFVNVLYFIANSLYVSSIIRDVQALFQQDVRRLFKDEIWKFYARNQSAVIDFGLSS